MSNGEPTRKDPEDEANAEERKTIEQARKRDRELASGAVEGRTHQQVMEAARANKG